MNGLGAAMYWSVGVDGADTVIRHVNGIHYTDVMFWLGRHWLIFPCTVFCFCGNGCEAVSGALGW